MPSFYTRDWWNENVTTFAAYENWQKGWNDYYLGLQDARDLYLLARAGGQGLAHGEIVAQAEGAPGICRQ